MPTYDKFSKNLYGFRPDEMTIIIAQTDVDTSQYNKEQRVRMVNRQLQEEIEDFEGTLQDEQ